MCVRKLRDLRLLISKSDTFTRLCRHQSSSSTPKMSAWQIHQYGGADELTLNNSARKAGIKSPGDLVVKVHASSVNPIDKMMMQGYGQALINVLRKRDGIVKSGTEFPLILGRDFSGTVVETGGKVKHFKPGDEVWGAISPARQGTHAQYAVVSEKEISKKPQSLSHSEASAIPYVAVTVWSALCTVGNLRESNAARKRLLILGGSGGIGTFAIQLAKGWGMDVTVTCGTDAVDLVSALGADDVVDYRLQNVNQELKTRAKFDMILDCVGGESREKAISVLSPWSNSKLVTLVTPLLKNSDSLGILPGIALSALNAGVDTLKGLRSGGSVRWAVFNPNGRALDRVRQMVEANQIRPVIQETYSYQNLPEAFNKLAQGHMRGKLVIDNFIASS